MKRVCVVAGLCILVVGGVVTMAWGPLARRIRSHVCQDNLRTLHALVWTDSSDRRQGFVEELDPSHSSGRGILRRPCDPSREPVAPSLGALAKSQLERLGDAGKCLIVCPCASTCPGEWGSVDSWADYVYVSWPSGADTPDDHPLIYDADLSNHGGRGINIVTVGGNVFWDAQADWLRRFVATHRELNVPLPRGVTLEARSAGDLGNDVDIKTTP